MIKVKLVLLSLAGMLSVGAMLAPSASAAIDFEWKGADKNWKLPKKGIYC